MEHLPGWMMKSIKRWGGGYLAAAEDAAMQFSQPTLFRRPVALDSAAENEKRLAIVRLSSRLH